QLLRRPGRLQRRLLPGAEDLLVVAARRAAPPRPAAGRSSHPGRHPRQPAAGRVTGYHRPGAGQPSETEIMMTRKRISVLAGAAGWMRGGTLPGTMMGTSTDPGKVMGSLWANAPGPRVSAAQATTLGSQVLAGARADRAANTITFTTTTVRLIVFASPSGGP